MPVQDLTPFSESDLHLPNSDSPNVRPLLSLSELRPGQLRYFSIMACVAGPLWCRNSRFVSLDTGGMGPDEREVQLSTAALEYGHGFTAVWPQLCGETTEAACCWTGPLTG